MNSSNIITKLFLSILLAFSLKADFVRDDANNIVLDTQTRLMWTDDNGIYTNWGGALPYCEDLTYGSYSDWRLPNINELKTLIDYTKSTSVLYSVFSSSIIGPHWSSTIDSSATNYHWYLDLYNGTSTTNYDSNYLYVKCVRGGLSQVVAEEEDSNNDNNNTIVHNGITYKTVTSPNTNKVWLDRNLGASQVCTSYNDSSCYGWYYQWGRSHDGHQDFNSTTTTLSPLTVTGHSHFIKNGTVPSDWVNLGVDDNGSLRSDYWSDINTSNNICPIGFRVPTEAELANDTTSEGVFNRSDAFSSFLKLPSAGYKSNEHATSGDVGVTFYMWTSTPDGNLAKGLRLKSDSKLWTSYYRTYGFNVRCIKN